MIAYARYTMRTARVLVVLDTMWGRGGDADRWFTINPRNHSGARLYWLTGLHLGQVWVTNACPQQTRHAHAHGKPDGNWLLENFMMLPARAMRLPMLVCGKVAQDTFRRMEYEHDGPVIELLHPAARTWTRATLDSTQRKLTTLLRRSR